MTNTKQKESHKNKKIAQTKKTHPEFKNQWLENIKNQLDICNLETKKRFLIY